MPELTVFDRAFVDTGGIQDRIESCFELQGSFRLLIELLFCLLFLFSFLLFLSLFFIFLAAFVSHGIAPEKLIVSDISKK